MDETNEKELEEQYNEYKKKSNINITFSEYLNIIISSQIILNAILTGALKSIKKYMSHNKNIKENLDMEGGKLNIKREVVDTDTETDIQDDEIPSPGLIVAKSLFNNVSNISKGVFLNFVKLFDDFVAKVIDMSTGNALKEPFAPETNQRIIVLAQYFKHASENPEVLNAIKQIGESITDTGLQISDVVIPGIEKIFDKFIKTAEKIGKQGAEGAMRTFISMASSTISLIPWLGGFISILISIGSAFNTAMSVGLIFTRNAGEQTVTSAQVAKRTIDIVSKGKNKLTKNISKLSEALTSGTNIEDNFVYKNIKKIGNEYTNSSIRKYIDEVKNGKKFQKEEFKRIIEKSIEQKEINSPLQLIPVIKFLNMIPDIKRNDLIDIGKTFIKKYPSLEKKMNETISNYEVFKEKVLKSPENYKISTQSGGIYKKGKYKKTYKLKNKKYIDSSKRIINSLYKFYNTRKNN